MNYIYFQVLVVTLYKSSDLFWYVNCSYFWPLLWRKLHKQQPAIDFKCHYYPNSTMCYFNIKPCWRLNFIYNILKLHILYISLHMPIYCIFLSLGDPWRWDCQQHAGRCYGRSNVSNNQRSSSNAIDSLILLCTYLVWNHINV